MKVQRIKISKFKSIYDTLEINFEDVRGFWEIGGAVGTGKTTLGEAIIFGLFGTVGGKNNGDLISWGQKHALVELWCQSNGHNIYIKREINKYGQSPIYAEVDGEELVFSNKRDAQTQLESEYYDVTRTTLELLCIISFNNFKSLATLNASDTKKFLDQVLGFYTLSQYSEACKELRRQTISEGTKLDTQINSNTDQINKIMELASLARIEGDMQETMSNIKTLEKERDEYDNQMAEKLMGMRKEWTGHQAEISKIKTLGANKKKEIDFIKKGTCPTCGAPIDQSSLSIKEQERQVLLDQYNAVTEKSNKLQTEIGHVEMGVKIKDGQFRTELVEMRNLLTQLKEQEKRSAINMGAVKQLEKENKKLSKDRDNISAEEAEWDELYNILNEGVRSRILASFIPTLNKNILKYTQQLYQPYVIEFDPSFKCRIKICGMDDEIALSSLSTGQLKTVDMCVIMGVLGTIMSNISFNITFLDELFSNMDAELRSTMCQVLRQNQKPGQTLFIISHVELDNKYFDGQINAKLEYIDEVHKKSVYTMTKNIIESQ
jgi:DNA repair exonuclease SbcCD ATPase subunit